MARTTGRLTPRLAAGATSLAVIMAGALTALPALADDSEPHEVDYRQYSVVSASSEAGGYPTPADKDGTVLGAIDGDYTTQWGCATSGGVCSQPQWVTFDLGGSFELTGILYSVKRQANGPIKDYAIYATDDKQVAKSNNGWGNPVKTGAIVYPADNRPSAHSQVFQLDFDQPVKARYVKFQGDDAYNAGKVVAIGEFRALATGDTSPQPDPGEAAQAATPKALTNGQGLTITVAEEFPQVIEYQLDGKTMSGQAAVLDSFAIGRWNDMSAYAAVTTLVAATTASATWLSKLPDFADLEITSTIAVADDNTVKFAIDKIEGARAGEVDQIAIPDHQLLSVTSDVAGAELDRTVTSPDSTKKGDVYLPLTASTPTDAKAVGTPYGFVTGGGLTGSILTNATADPPANTGGGWAHRLESQITKTASGTRAGLWVGPWTVQARTHGAAPAPAQPDPRVVPYEMPWATVMLATDAMGNADGTVNWQDGAIVYRDLMQRPLGHQRVAERVVQRIGFNFGSTATHPFMKTLDNTKRIAMTTDNLGQWVLEKGYQAEGHDSAHPDYGGNFNTRAGGLEDFNHLIGEGKKLNADFAVHINLTEFLTEANHFSDELTPTGGLGWNWV
ncbi:MAG: endo-alpha-N-acetylgalactosaminidase family protein, partial [Bifidobacteriaceae bacterium]|nr:endo-alpha-N-acetylgalactosaminidase family protein [Bifidobacteriaceae bacterium]